MALFLWVALRAELRTPALVLAVGGLVVVVWLLGLLMVALFGIFGNDDE